MEFLTVVNRTSRPLSCTWDGKQHTIPAKSKTSQPAIIARKLRNDNPIMGSDDPSTGQLQYLIGIEEEGDPITPIEQSDEIELYNRRLQAKAVPIMIIPGNTGGLYNIPRSPLPADGQFVSNKS